ncbi:sulfotransferase family protein [Mangrovivirga cuniculi]|uniref:Sulfotransferase domain-containing protein n=1 Tax=Mangrovivirga cuniculi TaxID=2715131 RepID=A0A4D7JYY0_9BACT|nr:sulfotransferase [Mangrovivirga cuniculi]QCK15915.1 hypothetical protein DCC35_14790 [Mangrovivirga cuniculi]
MKSNKMNFICLGAPKSGTTSLFHYLKGNPEVQMPFEKELHYFNAEDFDPDKVDVYHNNYFDNFEGLKGKVASRYFVNDLVPERLYNYNPDLKLIVIMREPVERAFSHYKMIKRIDEISLTLDDVLYKESSEKSFNKIKERVLGNSLYYSNIKKYLDFFPIENFHFMFLEELEANPHFEMEKLYSFLNINSRSKVDVTKKHFESKDGKFFNRLVPVLSKFKPLQLIWNSFPKKTKTKILHFYNTNIKTLGTKKETLSISEKKKYRKIFSNDISSLNNIVSVPWKEYNG